MKGTVRFADGSVVPYPQVYLYSDANGHSSYASTGENGNYSVFAVPAGSFTVDAQDNGSGLSAEVSGSLLDPATPVTMDITLPASGTVIGTMTDAAGNPVVEAELYVRSSSLGLDRQVFTGADGSYRVERIAVGQITVWARDPNNDLVSIGLGQIASNGQVVRIDLAPPTTGSLSGRVLGADGVTPVAEAGVTATTVTSFGPFEVLRFATTAAEDGSFVFDELPVGDFRVTARADGVIGRRQLAVDEDGSTVDVPLGDGVILPFDLTGADGSIYDFSCNASLGDGGFGSDTDAYDGTYQLTVNNWSSFPCVEIADTRQGGRELVFGPHDVYGEIEAMRQVYVPASGGYARYLEVLRNPTDQDVTVSVRVQGYLGSYPTQIVVAPASTGNRYAVTVQSDSDPALGHVFAGSGASVAGSFNFTSGGLALYEWSLVIPAGGQVSLLHFAIQRAHGDTAGAQQQAEALANGTQPGMFDGLSTTDRASLRNFVVTP